MSDRLALLAVVGPGEPGAVSFGRVGLILCAETAREASDPARRHRRICAAAVRGPVLPARRGARFSDLTEARAWAAAREAALTDGLARVAGRAEFVVALRAADPAPPPEPAAEPASPPEAADLGPGAAYLRARAAALAPGAAQAAAEAAALDAAKAALADIAALLAAERPDLIKARRLVADPARRIADLSLLAPRDAGPALADAVAQRRPDAAFSGPWPPYSFAELAA